MNGGWLALSLVKDLLKAAPGRILHDLRRSAVLTFVRRGISEHTPMKLTGHKKPSILRRYDIVSSEGLREATRKLDAPVLRRFASRK